MPFSLKGLQRRCIQKLQVTFSDCTTFFKVKQGQSKNASTGSYKEQNMRPLGLQMNAPYLRYGVAGT